MHVASCLCPKFVSVSPSQAPPVSSFPAFARQPGALCMQFTSIKETCLYVSNLKRTKEFYLDALGFELISYVKDRHIFFRVGPSILMCFLSRKTRKPEDTVPPHYGYGKLHLAFECLSEEYEAWKTKLENAELEIAGEQVREENGRRSFYFRDPDGHLLEVVEEGAWD